MRPARLFLATLICSLALTPALAQEAPKKVPAQRTQIVDGPRKLEIVDLAPRFLDFYAAAQGLDPEARWKLWQVKYGFAAVPPTPEGQKIARRLLDEAWNRYPAALPVIRRGAGAMEPAPQAVLKKVAEVLELDEPYEMQVLTYVGAFDGNAFTARQGGKPMVAIPIEMEPAERELVFSHEMAHAVHLATAGLSGGWERSIAETIVQEGLAMHVAKVVAPGRDDRKYVEHSPGWYDKATSQRREILSGIAPALEKSDSDTVFKYTMGQGATGLEREAYVAGWFVVGDLLKQGKTLPQIARIPSSEMPAVVRSAIEASLRSP